MNRKQLLTLLILVAAFVGAWLLLRRKEHAIWAPDRAVAGSKLLGDFPVNDVAQIVLQRGSNVVRLVKQEEAWRVSERNGYPADFNRIRDFLLKARDLKIVQSDPVSASQWARLDLDPAETGSHAPVSIEFQNQGGTAVRKLLVGKQHLQKPRGGGAADAEGWPDGRYIRVGSADAVALVSDPLESAEARPDAWLDKSFLRVQRPRSIEVDFPETTNSWKLLRDSESGEWKLANARPGEKLDPDKVLGVANPFSSPGFNDVLAGHKLGEAGTNRTMVVKVGTFDDFVYSFSIGSRTNDDYPVVIEVAAQIEKHRLMGKEEKPADRERMDKEFADRRQKLEDKLKQEQKFASWTYLVQGWSIEPMLKERSQLLAEKKENAKAEPNSSAPAVSVPAEMETNPPGSEPTAGTNAPLSKVE